MNAIAGTEVVREVVNEAVDSVPPAVPGEFVVKMGAGWGGPLHDLANALAVWGDGPVAAAWVLLGCLRFVEIEVEGVHECRDLLEGLGLLRGAVMAAGIEAAGRGGFGWPMARTSIPGEPLGVTLSPQGRRTCARRPRERPRFDSIAVLPLPHTIEYHETGDDH